MIKKVVLIVVDEKLPIHVSVSNYRRKTLDCYRERAHFKDKNSCLIQLLKK